jgi:hypothetical protein
MGEPRRKFDQDCRAPGSATLNSCLRISGGQPQGLPGH